MNKTEFIDAISEAADLSKAAAARAVKAMTDSITEELQKGGVVEIVGFGKFLVRERPERAGRNPKTGEPLVIKAANLPVFKAGKVLKDALQESEKEK